MNRSQTVTKAFRDGMGIQQMAFLLAF